MNSHVGQVWLARHASNVSHELCVITREIHAYVDVCAWELRYLDDRFANEDHTFGHYESQFRSAESGVGDNWIDKRVA